MPRLWLALASVALGGCNAIAIGGTVGVLSAGAALGYECPGYVTVSLRDGASGRELCNEKVVAKSGDRERVLTTCAPQGLPEGRWELRAARGGEGSVVQIEPTPHCERFVYAVELTLDPTAHFASGSYGAASTASSAPSPSKSARGGAVTSTTAGPVSALEKNFASCRVCSRTGISMLNDAGSRGKRSSPSWGTPGMNSRRSKRP